MSFDNQAGRLRVGRFPLLARALDRHMCWAFEHAAAGECDIAQSALLDVHAVASEIAELDDDLML